MVDLFCYLEYYFYIVAVWDYSGNFLYAEALNAITGDFELADKDWGL